jgi:hypothetical protein
LDPKSLIQREKTMSFQITAALPRGMVTRLFVFKPQKKVQQWVWLFSYDHRITLLLFADGVALRQTDGSFSA